MALDPVSVPRTTVLSPAAMTPHSLGALTDACAGPTTPPMTIVIAANTARESGFRLLLNKFEGRASTVTMFPEDITHRDKYFIHLCTDTN